MLHDPNRPNPIENFDFSFEDDVSDFNEDFEDGFEFLGDEPEPQGPRP